MTQAHGSKLRVLSSNGVPGALAQLGPQFERESGHTLDVSFDTANALATRIAAGERGDVAIVTSPVLAALAQQGITGGVQLLARSGAGVAVRAGGVEVKKLKVAIFKTNADSMTALAGGHLDLVVPAHVDPTQQGDRKGHDPTFARVP